MAVPLPQLGWSTAQEHRAFEFTQPSPGRGAGRSQGKGSSRVVLRMEVQTGPCRDAPQVCPHWALWPPASPTLVLEARTSNREPGARAWRGVRVGVTQPGDGSEGLQGPAVPGWCSPVEPVWPHQAGGPLLSELGDATSLPAVRRPWGPSLSIGRGFSLHCWLQVRAGL